MFEKITAVRCECGKCGNKNNETVKEILDFFDSFSDGLSLNKTKKLHVCRVIDSEGRIKNNIILEFKKTLIVDGVKFLVTTDDKLFDLTEYENLLIVEVNEELTTAETPEILPVP